MLLSKRMKVLRDTWCKKTLLTHEWTLQIKKFHSFFLSYKCWISPRTTRNMPYWERSSRLSWIEISNDPGMGTSFERRSWLHYHKSDNKLWSNSLDVIHLLRKSANIMLLIIHSETQYLSPLNGKKFASNHAQWVTFDLFLHSKTVFSIEFAIHRLLPSFQKLSAFIFKNLNSTICCSLVV